MKPFFFFLLSVLFLMSSCKSCKDSLNPEQKKPEPTTDGRNTFYCEINGKPYYQKFSGGQMYYPTVVGTYDNNPDYGGFFFRVDYKDRKRKLEYSLNFSLLRIFESRSYTIDTTKGDAGIFLFTENDCRYFYAVRYNSINGIMNLTKCDYKNGIISGTFNYKTWLPDSVSNGCDTVRIINGIFDLKL